MTGRLEGKAAIVTGAGSGIGRAIARRFAAEGAHVVVADMSGAEEETAVAIGGDCFSFRIDTSDAVRADALVAACIERFGRIDVLSNNAATGASLQPLHTLPPEAWARVMDVNALGYVNLMRPAIASMLETGGGAIVNMASLTAHRASPGTAPYVASKGAVIAVTRAAALEYAPHDIRVNSISPGAIATPMVERLDDDLKQVLMQQIPMRRFGTPEDVAALALFLASDEAGHISGQDIVIDGARSSG
jgi:meso-butanediol dehydrogenase / (S,S)-butanediol dehydrogenase / diacetyl reductase